MNIDPLQTVEDMIKAFQRVREATDEAEATVGFCDKEYNDLTHALELVRFNAMEGYKLAKQMQENRQRRREAKNMHELLHPLNELINRYQGLLKELKKVHATIEQMRGAQQKRIYTPRVRTDMQDTFNKVNAR